MGSDRLETLLIGSAIAVGLLAMAMTGLICFAITWII